LIKGCQKKMVVLKNIGSEVFEEAYFILRDPSSNPQSKKLNRRDMITEANRIVEMNDLCQYQKNKETDNHCAKKSSIIGFFLGMAFTSVLCVLLILLFSL